MKTTNRFVLIDNSNKKEIFLQWKTKYAMNRTEQTKFTTGMKYSARKTLISDLNPVKQQKHNSIKNTHAQIRTSASTNHLAPFIYANPQRQNITRHSHKDRSNFYRTRSLGRITRLSADQPSNKQEGRSNTINCQKLRSIIAEADKKNGRAICVIKSRRDGLRYKNKYSFFPVYQDIQHQQFVKQVKHTMFEQFNSLSDKKVYLFHLSKQPIYNIFNNLNPKQYVIFADVSPKFDIPFEMQMKLFEQASYLQQKIKQYTIQLQNIKDLENQQHSLSQLKSIQQEPKEKYQWQKIKDVKKYVQKLIENPKQAKKMKKQLTEKDQVQIWYEQKGGKDEGKKGEKNPFFDVQCHFPKQTAKIQTLTEVANRVAQLPKTVNKHELKAIPIQNMMEKIKRQNEDALRLKKMEEDKLRILGYKCEKQVLRDLDRKNIPLLFQNIPFMMQKYGINRAQIYNLYNLYKSLQKVSAMRLFGANEHRRVVLKGIDRQTFDQGLKGLEINAGDELVKNICYFPDFITWEQFIKIVSISMRKTPKSKLEAILEGLGSSDRGYLTIEQVDIMVGSSLQKIFGKIELQLRKYFVSLVMKTFDTDRSGTIQIDEIRQHVLTKGIQDLDLVSYLMLNS